MFTSCGWFFDELSGLETTQILRYAARAVELPGVRSRTGDRVRRTIRQAPHNLPERETAPQVYARQVKPASRFSRMVATRRSADSGARADS